MTRPVLTALTLVVVTLATTPVRSQSLAAAAKKEQERRKKAAVSGPTKVCTESDLPASPDSGTVTTSASPTSAAPAGGKNRTKPPTAEEMKASMMEAWKRQEAYLRARIAQAEEVVQRLGSHPTGGGRVCKIDEGVFQPGVTAPEQVVCPAQMESRYQVAKRDLDKLKAEFALAEDQARRAGLIR